MQAALECLAPRKAMAKGNEEESKVEEVKGGEEEEEVTWIDGKKIQVDVMEERLPED